MTTSPCQLSENPELLSDRLLQGLVSRVRAFQFSRCDLQPQRTYFASAQEDDGSVYAMPVTSLREWVKRVVPQLLNLAELPQDWDSYGGVAPSRDFVEQIIGTLKCLDVSPDVAPAAVPGSDGEIQLEWHIGNRDLELEFSPDGTVRYLATEDSREEEGEIEADEELQLLIEKYARTT